MLVMAGIKNEAMQMQETQKWYQRALWRASDLSMGPLVAHCHKGLCDCYLGLYNEKAAQLENKTALEMFPLWGMTYCLQS